MYIVLDVYNIDDRVEVCRYGVHKSSTTATHKSSTTANDATYCSGIGLLAVAQSGWSNLVNERTPGGLHAGCPASASSHCTGTPICVAAQASMRHIELFPLLRGPQTTATVGDLLACFTMDATASRHASGSGAAGARRASVTNVGRVMLILSPTSCLLFFGC